MTSDPTAAQQLTQLRATKRTRGIAVVVPFVLKQAACVIRMVERWSVHPPCTEATEWSHGLVMYFNKDLDQHPQVSHVHVLMQQCGCGVTSVCRWSGP